MCEKTALKRQLLPKRAGSISAESSVMASSTKLTANFTDGGCLGVAKVDPKIRSKLSCHTFIMLSFLFIHHRRRTDYHIRCVPSDWAG